MDIFQMQQKWKSIDIDAMIDIVFKQTENELIELNQAQLRMGENAVGGKMPFYKSKSYAKNKLAQGSQAGGRVDLFKEGELYKAFKEIIKTTEVVLESDDFKAKWQEKRYGKKNTYGVTDDNLEEYTWTVFYPLFIKNLNNAIN